MESDASVIGFEKLNLKGMTAAPKPKQDEATGQYLPNGAAAKGGLNRSILDAGMAQLIQFTQYKAIQKGKLVLQVPAHYSSQECSECGFTHGDNRQCQAVFSCQNCGHTENADSNASKVVQKRTVRLLASGYFLETKKERKTCKVARNAARRNEANPALGDPGVITVWWSGTKKPRPGLRQGRGGSYVAARGAGRGETGRWIGLGVADDIKHCGGGGVQ